MISVHKLRSLEKWLLEVKYLYFILVFILNGTCMSKIIAASVNSIYGYDLLSQIKVTSKMSLSTI